MGVRPTMVIWQVGANGAMKHMSPDDCSNGCSTTGVQRLKRGERVDVVLMDNQRAPAILASADSHQASTRRWPTWRRRHGARCCSAAAALMDQLAGGRVRPYEKFHVGRRRASQRSGLLTAWPRPSLAQSSMASAPPGRIGTPALNRRVRHRVRATHQNVRSPTSRPLSPRGCRRGRKPCGEDAPCPPRARTTTPRSSA